MSGLTIFGTSGGGKTVAIDNVLSLYPQIICHENYKGNRIMRNQIVWLKIDCPHNGSELSLCRKFFVKIDELLGTSHEKDNRGNNVESLILNMYNVNFLKNYA